MDLITFFLQFILVVLSGYIGYLFGRKQQREVKGEADYENRKKLVEALLAELEMNYEALKMGVHYVKNLKGNEIEWFTRPLFQSSYHSAINSGKFLLLSSENQMAVKIYYERIDKLNSIRSNPGATLIPKLYKTSIDTMKEMISSLIETYPYVVDALKQETDN